jgi:hypothetical protein
MKETIETAADFLEDVAGALAVGNLTKQSMHLGARMRFLTLAHHLSQRLRKKLEKSHIVDRPHLTVWFDPASKTYRVDEWPKPNPAEFPTADTAGRHIIDTLYRLCSPKSK